MTNEQIAMVLDDFDERIRVGGAITGPARPSGPMVLARVSAGTLASVDVSAVFPEDLYASRSTALDLTQLPLSPSQISDPASGDRRPGFAAHRVHRAPAP
ncbi:MAG TPA: hypothetical protein VF516_08635 [Kofleriaceae bacterium]